MCLSLLEAPLQCSKHPVWAILAARGQTRREIKNFSEEEDKLLVAAWLNVSIDPAHFGREFLISFIQIRSSHQIVAKVHLSTIGQLFKSVSTSSVHRLSKLRVEGKAV